MRSETASSMSKDQIIVALDVPTAAEARDHIDRLRDEVGAFKIGLQLYTSEGPALIREVVADGVKLFLDVKFHDIPVTVAKASVEVARLGVWMFNLHALGGSEMMRRSVQSVREVCENENLRRPKIIGVTVLTSSNQKTLFETGIEREVGTQVAELAKLCRESGLDGVVASPLETGNIRASVDNREFLIVTPGVRTGSVEADDQKRVMSPRDALHNGSNYLVIGRPILNADDPVDAVREIVEQIEK